MTDTPVRLIATDLDGTLVRADWSVSPRSTHALAQARQSGIKVVLITGRPKRWAQHVSDIVASDAVAVANGAMVFDGDLDEVLISRLLDPAHARAFGIAMRAHDPEVAFAAERPEGFLRDRRYIERWPADEIQVLDFEDLYSEPLIKMLIRHEGHSADSLLDVALEVARDFEVTLTHSSTDGLLEVSAAGVDKGTSLALLAQSWGIEPEEVIAFGDMPNDAAMLQWAGRSYAVANAHPMAKDAAKGLTAGVEEDGVAEILEQLA